MYGKPKIAKKPFNVKPVSVNRFQSDSAMAMLSRKKKGNSLTYSRPKDTTADIMHSFVQTKREAPPFGRFIIRTAI